MANVGAEKQAFFDMQDTAGLALTYDDVRLRTRALPDAPLPTELSISGRFSRNVSLTSPFVSAAMDTVTTSEMAIAMARLGGIGVIHAGLDIDAQRREVRRVKLNTNAVIDKPRTVRQTDTVQAVLNYCAEHQFDFRTFPVLDGNKRFVGLITQSDIDFCEDFSRPVSSIMTPAEAVLSHKGKLSVEEAYRLMSKRKVKTLPVLKNDGRIAKLYLYSDVKRVVHDSGTYNTDNNGRLRVAAAVPTNHEALTRIEAMKEYLDVVVIDTADGDSFHAFKTLQQLKEAYPDIDVVVGNVSDGVSARLLADAGADGIKVGQGPGSICTTRVETGIGMPQVSALWDCARALGERFEEVPLTADGGIRNHGDIPIAFAVGASAVMMGSMLAGTSESPGEVIARDDGNRVKLYRGMGSASALRDSAASRARYDAGGGEPLAEGVEAYIPYKGSVVDVVEMCRKALIKSMRYCKVSELGQLYRETRLVRITGAGLSESHAHIARS